MNSDDDIFILESSEGFFTDETFDEMTNGKGDDEADEVQ